MKERRKKAHDGCFCTHESNSYYPSLPFNPGHLIQIKKLEREMKKARKADRESRTWCGEVLVTNLNCRGNQEKQMSQQQRIPKS